MVRCSAAGVPCAWCQAAFEARRRCPSRPGLELGIFLRSGERKEAGPAFPGASRVLAVPERLAGQGEQGKNLEVFRRPWRRPKAGEGNRRGARAEGLERCSLAWPCHAASQPCCSPALPAACSRLPRTGRQEPSCCLRLPALPSPPRGQGGQRLVPTKACQESACERVRAVHGLGSCITSAALRRKMCSGLWRLKSAACL